MRKLILAVSILLIAGCSSGPPADVKGNWVGWCEPAMDTKTGMQLEITQNGKELTGKYSATQVSNMGGEEKQEGTLTGTVSGSEATVKFSKTFDDIDAEPVPLTLAKDGDKDVLAGVFVHEGGVGTKYRFEKKK